MWASCQLVIASVATVLIYAQLQAYSQTRSENAQSSRTVLSDGIWQRTDNGGGNDGSCSSSNSVLFVEDGTESFCNRKDGNCQFDRYSRFRQVASNRYIITILGSKTRNPIWEVEATIEEGGTFLRYGRVKMLSDEYRIANRLPFNDIAEKDVRESLGVGLRKCKGLTIAEWRAVQNKRLAGEAETVPAPPPMPPRSFSMTQAQRRTISALVLYGFREQFSLSESASCSERVKENDYAGSDYTRRALANACGRAIAAIRNVTSAPSELCREGRVVIQDFAISLGCIRPGAWSRSDPC